MLGVIAIGALCICRKASSRKG